ncbi:hypothetical protein C8Q78DRAFT_256677 [Trametes maxima]|nr:hypothetical protein C8Q78DRAFT_256677 [Trametes maxima]
MSKGLSWASGRRLPRSVVIEISANSTSFVFYSKIPCAGGNTQRYVVKPLTLEPLLPVDLRVLQEEPSAPVGVDDTFIERAPNARGPDYSRWNSAPNGGVTRVFLQGFTPLARH